MRLFFLALIILRFATSFAQTDSLKLSPFNLNAGVSVSPQMLFIGALDMGAYVNLESQPYRNTFSLLGGIELRNRWFTANITKNAGTKDLRTHYSLTGFGYLGVGLSYISTDKKERNSFYLTASPYLFSYKESVSNMYFSNTIPRNTNGLCTGITWCNTSITKKGRRINTQFFIPMFSSNFLDDMRFMSLRFGVDIL